MTYDGNQVTTWAACLWRPDGSHKATPGDWFVRDPDERVIQAKLDHVRDLIDLYTQIMRGNQK